jgi:hypothetical protein
MHDNYVEYNDEPVARVERRAVWIVLTLLVVLTTAGSLWLRETDANHDVIGYAGRTGVLRSPDNGKMSTVSVVPEWAANEAVGTAGIAPDPDLPVIREIETIARASSPDQLVGRKVDLQIALDGRANKVAFWVGPVDNRVLVVMERDRRSSAAHQQGLVPSNDIAPVQAGQQAEIVGTIQRVPREEDRYSWGLSYADVAQLTDRPFYIRAESVRTGA